MKVFDGLDELVAAAGSQLGPTDWLAVEQDRVNKFADATDDHQWIHVDPEQAANGPFGGTIAHGLLTLSLLPHFMHELYAVNNVAMAINYGFNKVRFITPVRVGAKVRARSEIATVQKLDGAVQATLVTTIEVEGSDKPAAVIESIVRYVWLTLKVAAAQQLYRALAAGDRDALASLLHPEFVGHATEGLPLNMGGEHAGAEAMQKQPVVARSGATTRPRRKPTSFGVSTTAGFSSLVTIEARAASREGDSTPPSSTSSVSRPTAGSRRCDQLTDSAAWTEALGAEAPLETIDYSVVDGVATVCLNRPDVRNAIDMRVGEETLEVARRIADDPTVRAVLICGNGPALSVGGDIDYFLQDATEQFGELFARMTTPFHEAFRVLSRIDAPIVTAAHGAVAGGGLGYVYAADLVVAAEGTKFVTAFAALGLSGDGGGTWHLPRLIGARRAAQAYLRNTPIAADEALEWGLSTRSCHAAELRNRAAALATELGQWPHQRVRQDAGAAAGFMAQRPFGPVAGRDRSRPGDRRTPPMPPTPSRLRSETQATLHRKVEHGTSQRLRRTQGDSRERGGHRGPLRPAVLPGARPHR